MGQCLLRAQNPPPPAPSSNKSAARNRSTITVIPSWRTPNRWPPSAETDAAVAAWLQVLESHTYARARVLLAELYLARNQRDLARAALRETLNDDAHAPNFQRKRDRVWIRKARPPPAKVRLLPNDKGQILNDKFSIQSQPFRCGSGSALICAVEVRLDCGVGPPARSRLPQVIRPSARPMPQNRTV